MNHRKFLSKRGAKEFRSFIRDQLAIGALTMSSLQKACGVSRATAFRHFGPESDRGKHALRRDYVRSVASMLGMRPEEIVLEVRSHADPIARHVQDWKSSRVPAHRRRYLHSLSASLVTRILTSIPHDSSGHEITTSIAHRGKEAFYIEIRISYGEEVRYFSVHPQVGRKPFLLTFLDAERTPLSEFVLTSSGVEQFVLRFGRDLVLIPPT